jgi:hAT family C-terminal dimerisation region
MLMMASLDLLGIRIIRLRLLDLFDIMFDLDLRHYCATLLHPCYRQLKGCTNDERDQVHMYVRAEMKRIRTKSKEQQKQDEQPTEPKKPKVQHSILQQYEDDDNDNQTLDHDSSSGSEDFPLVPPPPDELSRYLAMSIDKKKLPSNPLTFWRDHQGLYPILSILAKQIHCIPASSSAVERCFSSAGFIVNERRTCLNPEQVDNIIVVRSIQRLDKQSKP